MQVILSKDIIGYKHNSLQDFRLHARKGDTLDVILHNETHFICDSVLYPDTTIVVYPSQCKTIIHERETEDMYAPEKYYNVYEDIDEMSIIDKAINNDLFDSNETEY